MASRAVLCTNGFVDHVVEDAAGSPIRLAEEQRIVGRVGYMTAFVEETRRSPASISYIRNTVIGGETPYVYVTRRTYDRQEDTVTLTCMGGPEYPFHDPVYKRESPFPGRLLAAMDEEVRPFAQPARPPGLPYDFHWHGLMGYNDCGIRIVGAHPRHNRLLYNLGCNGVGFLPSIHGGRQVARILAGVRLAVGHKQNSGQRLSAMFGQGRRERRANGCLAAARFRRGQFVLGNQVRLPVESVDGDFALRRQLIQQLTERSASQIQASRFGQPGRIVKCKGWETDPNAYLYFITQAPVWEKICDVIGEPGWKTHPDYAKPPARLSRLNEIFARVEQWTMTKTKFEAMEILNKDDIPCGPILSMKEIIEDQSLRATGTVVEVDHPTRGKYISVGNPIKLSDSPSDVTRSPLLGEHTDEILRQVLGFSDHQVAEIHDSGALAPPRKQAAE
jgi:hypothetical protein